MPEKTQKSPAAGPVDAARLRELDALLQKYRAGKANLEQKIIANEQYWKLRHWQVMRHASRPGEPTPASAWLFNALANKHADAMDAFPEPCILPREPGDEAEARMLSGVLPALLEQNDFEQVYSDEWWYKLKHGSGVYGVFWNREKAGGLGDIEIRRIDLLELFWQPGVTDIQASPYLFHVRLEDNAALEAAWPQLAGRLAGPGGVLSRYLYDDAVDTSQKSPVVDCYYKRRTPQGTVLHYVKYCAGTVLFATENDPAFCRRGLYDHAKYPFVFDTLFPMEGSPAGFGIIDVCRDAQNAVDLLNQAVLENALEGATPRYFVRADGAVNEAEFADRRRKLIHVDGNLGEDSLRPVQLTGLDGVYVTVLRDKIDELKETSGNRDVNSGGASGVTAASAIAAMQEAGSKLSRDGIKTGYRAYRQVVVLCIELLRQFYDVGRAFRITGAGGEPAFVRLDNAGLRPQPLGEAFGVPLGSRTPEFDIRVSAQKASPYSKAGRNELALQLYGLGFFDPARVQQSLACLQLMDFDGRDALAARLGESAGAGEPPAGNLAGGLPTGNLAGGLPTGDLIGELPVGNLPGELPPVRPGETPQAAAAPVPPAAAQKTVRRKKRLTPATPADAAARRAAEAAVPG